MYTNIEGWHTPEVQRSKEPSTEVCILLHQHAKEFKLYPYHHADRELTLCQRSFGQSAWNVLWVYSHFLESYSSSPYFDLVTINIALENSDIFDISPASKFSCFDAVIFFVAVKNLFLLAKGKIT